MTTETPPLAVVTDDDMALVERELDRTPHPQSTRALAEKLAFEKTASERAQDVKKYDPYARFEVGDLIEKEYNEPLTVGSKAVEHFQGRVVLKVVAKTYSKHFNCEMLEVEYPGGGVFRKYLDYMKKTKTQVLLPSALEGRSEAPEIMAKSEDPRLTELPMTERDLKTLEKNLRARLAKDPNVFGWNDQWHLVSRRIEIPGEKVQEIASGLAAEGRSASTEELVRRHFALEPSNDMFDLACLSLSALLDKKHKKEFVLLTSSGWGRWHLKSVLNALPEGLPLAAPLARLPEFEQAERPEMSVVQDFPIKVYLTWREILSGGIKVPRSLSKALSHVREYAFLEADEGKTYTLYYYPQQSFFLGLQDYYAQHNIPQGTSLTLERTGPDTFKFWIKRAKKKAAVLRLSYDAETDEFRDLGEEALSIAEPNKIIAIDRDTLTHLLPLTAERDDLDLRELLLLIFKDPALATSSRSLHFLRAYHLVDMIRQTTQEDVEIALLSSPEFVKSEKKKGVFAYQEPFVPEEVAPLEEAFPEAFAEAEPLTPEEAALQAVAEELLETEAPAIEEPAEETRAEAPPTAPAAPAKKEKPAKKKKPKAEGEKGPRPKKSERRVLEEKIVEEEAVEEALAAVKEKEEEALEHRAGEKGEEFKPAPAAEEPKFGLFGDLLKSALKKKEPAKTEEEKK